MCRKFDRSEYINVLDMDMNIIDDTFAEAFSMYVARVLITAANRRWALIAARLATGFASSIIMCPCEAGIECFVKPECTPDKRPGILVQFWHNDLAVLKQQVIARISQVVLTCPTTAVFDGLPRVRRKITIGSVIAKFGDGFEVQDELYGRKIWKIPVMEGEFIIEDKVGVVKGVAGGNIIILSEDCKSALSAAERAVKAIRRYCRRVITPFPGGICRAGSKVGSITYPKLKASTNHLYCPTLKEKLRDTKLLENVNCVYEIVINGLTLEDVTQAMGIAIKAASISGVVKITAGNYGGKLGPYKIYLKEAVEKVKDVDVSV